MDQTPDLSYIASGYQVNLTAVSPTGSPGIRVLKADPRRWYLNITMPQAGLTACAIFPGGLPSTPTVPGLLNTSFGLELTFAQAPGMIGGEWWMIGNGTTGCRICEILKVA